MRKFKNRAKILGVSAIAVVTVLMTGSNLFAGVVLDSISTGTYMFWNFNGGNELLSFWDKTTNTQRWAYLGFDPTNGLVAVGKDLLVNGVVNAQNYACSSDFRYKKDITAISNPLDKLCRLNGVSFNWKADELKDKNFSKDRQIGFIAQDVEKVFPELVYTDNKGYKSLSYDKMSVVIVEAMKEMKKSTDNKIAALEKENEMLKTKLAALEKMNERIARIEKMMESKKIANN